MEYDARAARRHCRSQMPPKKKAKKRPREEEKTEGALASSVLSAVTCPISHSLAVQPVLAEDGQCYEREEITKWLNQKHTSPVTNEHMGTRLVDHVAGRNLVSSLIASGAVDAEAASAWHLASARLKIVGKLPGGLNSAKEHLLAARPPPEHTATDQSPACETLLEACELSERMTALVKRGNELDVGIEVERLLASTLTRTFNGITGKEMTEFRDDLVPGQSVVRVIDDEDYLQILCKQKLFVYCRSMAELCGEVMTIDKLLPSRSGYTIDGWTVPYSACILVKV